jgi:uncharacterized protein YeaO (DUF488 family)
MIHTKRVYDKSLCSDTGYTILVDRLWPRGLRKDEVVIDLWLKDISPSTQLRRWFGHDPGKWDEFKERYFEELKSKMALVETILEKAKKGSICLLYGAKDEKHNNAVALKELLDHRLGAVVTP